MDSIFNFPDEIGGPGPGTGLEPDAPSPHGW